MKIALISDTHSKPLPKGLVRALYGVELILHAGDISSIKTLDELSDFAPVISARGNEDLELSDPRVKDNVFLEISGFKIGVSHDLPLPELPPWRTFEGIMEERFGARVDIYIYGDTHTESISLYKDTLLVNPGSLTLPHNFEKPGTLGIMEIKERVFLRIIQL